MATGFKCFATIEELETAIANAPEVEVIVPDTVGLLQTVWHEFHCTSQANSSVQREAGEKVMRLVCEALEVDAQAVLEAWKD